MAVLLTLISNTSIVLIGTRSGPGYFQFVCVEVVPSIQHMCALAMIKGISGSRDQKESHSSGFWLTSYITHLPGDMGMNNESGFLTDPDMAVSAAWEETCLCLECRKSKSLHGCCARLKQNQIPRVVYLLLNV